MISVAAYVCLKTTSSAGVLIGLDKTVSPLLRCPVKCWALLRPAHEVHNDLDGDEKRISDPQWVRWCL